MRSKRHVALGAFSTVAFVLVLTSVAYACTVFKGSVTFKGSASTNTITAVGDNSGMSWCSTSGSSAVNKSSASTVTVQAAPTTACTVPLLKPTNKLPAKTYDITWLNGTFNASTNDCMDPQPSGQKIGTVTVDVNGNSSAVTSSSFTPNGGTAVAVCVTANNTTEANATTIATI